MTEPIPDDLFQALSAPATLDTAWDKVRTNAGCAGGDGETVTDFGRRAANRLVALSLALREGRYHPSDLRILAILKKSGGTRPLAIPSVVDRVAQTACTHILGPLLDPLFDEASFAYRPGRSVLMAVRAIERLRKRGFTQVVEADIVRCFERIVHPPLLDRLETALDGRPGADRVVDLIALWIEHASLELQTPGIGLAQGSPLSPLLANLYLDQLDDALEKKGIHFVRFADDFVLLSKSRQAAEHALDHTGDVLGRHGLELKSEKTRIVDFDRGFTFLGHLFVRSMILKQVADPEEDAVEIMRDIGVRDRETAEAAAQETEAKAEERAAGYDRGQRVLYMTDAERHLTLRNMSFAVKGVDDDHELLAIAHARVDRIELGPFATVDTAVLHHALATDTDLAFVNGHGETLGWLYRPHHDRAALHLAQARVALDTALAARLARSIVVGRLHNQRAQLHRLNRETKDADVIVATKTLARMIRKLPTAADVAALRGHEGAAAALYWPALGRLTAYAPQPFRRKRPATDALNAAINYLTAMLSRDVRAAILRSGLHAGFGVLHAGADGHEACVWDLMEGFRAPLTEGLPVALFNQGRLKEEMFAATKDGGIHMGRDAVRAIIRGYETAANRLVTSPRTGKKHTWRVLMEEDARAYGNYCRTPEAALFTPYIMDY